MNKIILSTIALSFSYLISFSQTVFEVKDLHTNYIVSNGLNITTTTTISAQTSYDFEIKNISTSSQTLTIKRFDDVINTVSPSDMAIASFCTGANCYPPNITTATIILAPNATIDLKADLDEASIVGVSDVRYRIYDTDNTPDLISFTLKYNSPVSIKNNSSFISSVSDVYPNPSAGKTNLTITSSLMSESVKITIINSLGAVVSTKTIDLNVGKNSTTLDTENLSTGLYFAIITQGTQKITKKITISK